MNWRRFTFDNPDLMGRNILLKMIGEDGVKYFCGRLRRLDDRLILSNYELTTYYLLTDAEDYYYIIIDEIK